jgi:Acetyltransferase (GNAT) family
MRASTHTIRRVNASDLRVCHRVLSWSTTGACRIGVMNDSFVAEGARGQGLAEALIDACRTECTPHGARKLTWQTAPDNLRAKAIYERVGATAEQWIDYSLPPNASERPAAARPRLPDGSIPGRAAVSPAVAGLPLSDNTSRTSDLRRRTQPTRRAARSEAIADSRYHEPPAALPPSGGVSPFLLRTRD